MEQWQKQREWPSYDHRQPLHPYLILRAMPLTTAQQLAITIRVLASRSFQLNAGDSFGVAQSMVSRVVASVSDWFHQNSERFVKWHDERSRNAMQHRVFHDTGLPGVVGAIDGTHIAIPKPGDAQYSYINRKDFASINMGAIVDDNYRFLWFSARWPGRAHDSRVWRESQLYRPLRASRLIATAVCLRNAAITFREPDPYDDEGIEIEWEDDIGDGPEPDLNSGRNIT
ncbi:hypothetical protein ANCCEY_12737 [Ancylostoma ceylanicum]|uniref:DDE Tnp4 domain-containing protein n=1 Tax=Ancylostoma ceylanicum TaxID=53326 RepID=A0A0D6LE13_9BILA|nr:hypothetical protein ANCCEY_12737 [Ancylostoma ceylanicum]